MQFCDWARNIDFSPVVPLCFVTFSRFSHFSNTNTLFTKRIEESKLFQNLMMNKRRRNNKRIKLITEEWEEKVDGNKWLPVHTSSSYHFNCENFICFMNNFFSVAAALHSAWIDAYTMFHANDDGRQRKRNETNLFASFHVILLSNSKINKITHSAQSKIIFDCVFDFRAK